MARRRMLSTRISLSKKVNHVSDQAALLYTWMIPHLDELGLMEADPEVVKAQVVPMRITFTTEVVASCMDELEGAGLIMRYKANSSTYLSDPKFFEFQTFKGDRKAKTEYPIPGWIKIEEDENGKQRITLDSKGFQKKPRARAQNLNLTKGNLKVSKGNLREECVGTESSRLAALLFTLILEHNPNAKEPDLEKWAQEIDRMIRLDKRDPQEVEEIIRWCQTDNFWFANILSAKKLREKYDQLVAHMGRELKKSEPKGMDGIRYLAEREGMMI